VCGESSGLHRFVGDFVSVDHLFIDLVTHHPVPTTLPSISFARLRRSMQRSNREAKSSPVNQTTPDVRFTPQSGHDLSALGCPLSAKSGSRHDFIGDQHDPR